MQNKTSHLRQFSRSNTETITSAAFGTSSEGFDLAIELGQISPAAHFKINGALELAAANLPYGGWLFWRWDNDGIAAEATGIVGCGQLELAAIAEATIDAVCACVERKEVAA